MMYVEFIERDRHVPIEVFRQLGNQGSGWTEGATDRLVLQLGRTMRLGPHPGYLAFWEIPDLSRLDDWETYFRSPAALQNRRSQAMHRAINIQRAGLYDVLLGQPVDNSELFIIEYWRPSFARADILEELSARGQKHRPLELLWILNRIGGLGPEPPVMAVWGGTDYVAFEPLCRDAQCTSLELVTCGVYRPFGLEIL